jgi:hypothetical protein
MVMRADRPGCGVLPWSGSERYRARGWRELKKFWKVGLTNEFLGIVEVGIGRDD